jgi:hypothetical protein
VGHTEEKLKRVVYRRKTFTWEHTEEKLKRGGIQKKNLNVWYTEEKRIRGSIQKKNLNVGHTEETVKRGETSLYKMFSVCVLNREVRCCGVVSCTVLWGRSLH